MERVIRSPGKYIQGVNVLEKAGEYVKELAGKFLILATPSAQELASGVVGKSLKSNGLDFHIVKFNRECSKSEIKRLVTLMEIERCDGVIGIGGGKAMDTAKAVAYQRQVAGCDCADHCVFGCSLQCSFGDLHR